jgi:hypothetical protein
MPPLQALVALHGLWILAFLALIVWAERKWSTLCLRFIGHSLSAVGLMALGIVAGNELLTWYPAVNTIEQKYLPQRIVYVLGTNTDLPVIQAILSGIALSLIARRRKATAGLAE